MALRIMRRMRSSKTPGQIRSFHPADENSVIALWRECGLTRPWNDPHRDIQRKLSEQPELFLVATIGDALVGSAMVGFDGHRGWVYYLAVSLQHRKQSIGRALMHEAERLLARRSISWCGRRTQR
jgi:ribosomal protein S18 acetylase RimI-like enzyme